jgi:hypothetical protein
MVIALDGSPATRAWLSVSSMSSGETSRRWAAMRLILSASARAPNVTPEVPTTENRLE